MSNWAGGVLTAAGRTLQAKVEAGTTLNITKIKLGDGTENMSAVDGMTDLVSPKAVLGISSATSSGQTATITGILSATQLSAGFWCREWGLFAQDPDVGEILYMITIDNQPEWLPASTEAAQISATYAMNIAVANATNIEVQIDPAGLVDVEMLQSYIGLSKRSTAYVLGDTTLLENIPAGFFVECTTAGTTGAAAPVITPPVLAGQTIADGTVVWTIRQIASTQDLTKYLLLSGGAMTGSIIKRSVDNGELDIIGGNDEKSGKLLVFGKEHSTYPGEFWVISQNNNGYSSLAGKATGSNQGSLTWCGTDLGGSAIVAESIGSSGYKKTADGFIMQWGANGIINSSTIYFPISFSAPPRVIATPVVGSTNSDISVTVANVTETTVDFVMTNNTGLAYEVHWIAIGK